MSADASLNHGTPHPTAPAFAAALDAETLSALMRSTWTWDDRALRRDLAALLVDLAAAQWAAQHEADADSGFAAVLSARAHSSAARFVGAVLGPKLIADTGNKPRQLFVTDAVSAAHFDREASTQFARIRDTAPAYVAERTRATEYPDEQSWMPLLAYGEAGLGKAMRAFGYTLSDADYFGRVGLAWQTLRAVPRAGKAHEYADKMRSGELTAALAAAEQTGSWDPAMVRTKAVEGDDGWRLTGVKQFVVGASDADVLLVIARSTAGPSLFAVEASAAGVTVSGLDVTDATRPLWSVELSNAPAVLLDTEGAGGRLMLRAIDLAGMALAAEQVGLIEKAMSLLASREAAASDSAEFSTRIVDVALDHAAAYALWQRSLAAEASGTPDEAAAAAAAAHIGCSAAAVRAADAAAEILGPSEETTALAHRALSSNLLFGGPALSHERLLERLGV